MIKSNPLEDKTKEELKDKIMRLCRLLLEARDALPAISLTSARLHNVNLSLADRIESELEPWLDEESGKDE